MNTPNIIYGNADTEGRIRRGWFVGHFLAVDDLRKTDDIEIKWSNVLAGSGEDEWSSHDATSMALLVRGRVHIWFSGSDVVLTKEGDYVLWGPGVMHRWEVEEDALVVTIRWPSCVK